MPPAGLKPTITASERPQTHAFDRAATGIGIPTIYVPKTPHISYYRNHVWMNDGKSESAGR